MELNIDCPNKLAEDVARIQSEKDLDTPLEALLWMSAEKSEQRIAALEAKLAAERGRIARYFDLLHDIEAELCPETSQALAELPTIAKAIRTALLAAQADSRRLDWLDKYYDLKITTTTIAGAAMKHIESDGTALYASGGDLRDTIDAAMNGEAYS